MKLFQLKQLKRRNLKKFRLERESNPWPLRYRCIALTNWAIKPTGSWSIVSSYLSRWWRNEFFINSVVYFRGHCCRSNTSEISQSDSVAISSNWYGSTLNATGLSSSAIFNAKKTGEDREFSPKITTILFNTRLWILSYLSLLINSDVTESEVVSIPPVKRAVISETFSWNLRISSYFWLYYSF